MADDSRQGQRVAGAARKSAKDVVTEKLERIARRYEGSAATEGLGALMGTSMVLAKCVGARGRASPAGAVEG